MAGTLLVRAGFPKVPGDQPWSVLSIKGPTSYVEVVPGAPGPPVVLPTGGQKVTAQDFGLQALVVVFATASNDGKYSVDVIPVGSGEFGSVLLSWSAMGATPAEVPAATDLSASTVQLLALGR